MLITPLFINLHSLPLTARIKFKALMFAYKTTSGSAPLYLNSLLQTYVLLETCVLQVNDALLFIPKRQKITFTDFYINCSLLTDSITAAESLTIFKNQLKTHLFIFIWLSNSSTLYSNTIIKKIKNLPLLDLHSIHLLTACFLYKKIK